MGNVLAASAPPPSVPPPPVPGLLMNVEQKDPSTMGSTTTDTSDTVENPGTMEDLHKKCKDVFPITFEGAKIVLSKSLSAHFHISHTINMSSTTPSGYKFGTTYVGTKQASPMESFPVLLGDIDSSGNLSSNIIHQFGNRIRGKWASQIQRNKLTAHQITTDYRGDAFTLSLTVANTDILNGNGFFVTNYLQSITPSIAVGGEVACQRGHNVPGGQIVVASLGGRYTNGDSTVSGSFGPAGCHICFHQKASDQLQFGAELEISSRMQESIGSIAYQVDLPKADVVFRGSVDTNWTVGGVLEKKLHPLPFSFALSGMINHSKQQFRLGCGVVIG